MREAIGGTWIMGIVVFFIILFSGYLAISVNYSKAFKVKNSIINIIEKNRGYGDTTKEIIDDYLNEVGYAVYSSCDKRGVGGGSPLKGTTSKYKYCIEKTDVKDSLKKSYYTVTVFFKLDLPIFNEIFTFPIYGVTKTLYFTLD